MKNILTVEIQNIRGIGHLKINMPLTPDVYAITGINGIGKSTLLSCITPRLKRPVSFDSLTEFSAEDSSIKYQLDSNLELWTVSNGTWTCAGTSTLPLRGFQEGSLTNGTRFFNISSSGFRYYRQLMNVDPELVLPADDFVKENLGKILQNDKNAYVDLYRLDRSKAASRYKYKGVVYYLKIKDKLVSQFELSTGEFLLINLLHLFNNLLVRTHNAEKLNMILIDEIELALHPSAIKRLMDFTKDIAGKYNVAIYFSTHSLEIINSLPTDKEDVAKGRAAKKDPEYFTNGKNLFSILSEKYENQGHSRKEFREKICSIAVEYLDSSAFEEKLTSSLSTLFKR